MTDPMSTLDDQRDDGPLPDRRPIPDGGLGSAMPDWMRQTPSWKRQSEPTATRMIPEVDASIIDPRQLIDVDDLPQWLQAVASRRGEPISPVAEPPVLVPEPPTIATTTDDIASNTPPSVVERSRTGPGNWLPIPGTDAPVERPEHVRLTPSPLDAVPPWWMSDAVIAFLFVAIILTLIYVILAAAGVL